MSRCDPAGIQRIGLEVSNQPMISETGVEEYSACEA
jgi:hypothetical protein